MSIENDLSVLINGQKQTGLESMMGGLPPEAAQLLSMMQNPTANIVKNKVSETSPDLRSILEQDPILKETALIRSKPKEIQELEDKQNILAYMKTEVDPLKKLTIFEQGIALEITVGTTTRSEAIEAMKKYSKINVVESEAIYQFTDITVSIFFTDENIVSEIKFGEKYKGKTSKGLSIGDHIDKAIQLYGQPKMKSPKGAIWAKFAVFCDKDIIISIRIQK